MTPFKRECVINTFEIWSFTIGRKTPGVVFEVTTLETMDSWYSDEEWAHAYIFLWFFIAFLILLVQHNFFAWVFVYFKFFVVACGEADYKCY